jgi:hypothetical protein
VTRPGILCCALGLPLLVMSPVLSADMPDAKALARLIDRLGSDDFETREEAARQVQK